jgi:transcriptional regulator with XRE-family HTH domain
MSFGENVRHIRQLLGWSRSDMLRRLCPNADGRERARVSQQVYQLERRSSRRSELLLPIADLFGIAHRFCSIVT